jgi:uncharacterized membrane protein YfcA
MQIETAGLLLGAGLIGGVVTALVGGASLVTFPALLAAGLPPVLANASNMVALTPASFAAIAADRAMMPRADRMLLGIVAVSLASSVAGALLLLATPEKAFTTLVPVLIGVATLLFAFAERIREAAAQHARADAGGYTASALQLAPFAPLGLYGGYFGAGMSVMLLAILSIIRPGAFRATNALKNLLSGLTSGMAVIVFLAHGAVAWPETLVLMAGGLLGGYAGGHLARILPRPWLRLIVIVAGSVLTVVYAWRYWT